ncbi:hypothetical protein E3Q23_02750 [Wallemia mellicola]|uniref:Amino acid transporter transmembrane domain-containing protein n=1 Tax=Wallemia mellicola TaxID=1708541 RepID=A0A4T0LW34_9BASI|nr:hypothetical protein E3Q23_02750 [Wallemia mellicola]TIC64178.1 hypothetical protein E3Q01_02956 [Wallemia mellicola]
MKAQLLLGYQFSLLSAKRAKIFNEAYSTNEPEVIECKKSRNPMDVDRKSASSDEEKSYDSTISQSGDMSWQKATFVLLSETIAIGVLSMPSACHRIGVVPAVITIVFLGVLAWRTGIVIGSFSKHHPQVRNFADAGAVMSTLLYRVFAALLMLKGFFRMASHISAGISAFTFFSNNTVCSTIFGIVIVIIGFLLSIPRKFKHTSFVSLIGFICIVISCFLTLIGVAIERPQYGEVTWKAFNNPGLNDTVGAITDIIYGYSAHGSFFTFISEMKGRSRDFKKSLTIVQTISISFYVVIGAGVYIIVGDQNVLSPALLIPHFKIAAAAYVIALPCIIISAVIQVLVTGKFVVTNCIDPTYLDSKTWKASWIWYTVVFGIWSISFIISELVPFFNDLLSLTSSIEAVCLSYYATSILWFYDNQGRMFVNRWKITMFLVAVISVALGAVITPLGMATSIMSIANGFKDGQFGLPFACKS